MASAISGSTSGHLLAVVHEDPGVWSPSAIGARPLAVHAVGLHDVLDDLVADHVACAEVDELDALDPRRISSIIVRPEVCPEGRSIA